MLENVHYTVGGVEGGGFEIQPQNKLYSDRTQTFWENTEIL